MKLPAPFSYAALVLAGAMLAGCGGSPEPEATPPNSRAAEGRGETGGIRNTENIGYAGNAVADKVDGALDTHDQRKQELDKQLDATEQGN